LTWRSWKTEATAAALLLVVSCGNSGRRCGVPELFPGTYSGLDAEEQLNVSDFQLQMSVEGATVTFVDEYGVQHEIGLAYEQR
jgi:hypothetical protein